MKKIVLLSVLALLLIPGTVSASVEPEVTVAISADGMSFTYTSNIAYWDTIVVTFCDETEQTIPTNFPTEIYEKTFTYPKPISHVLVNYGQIYQAEDSRSCMGNAGRDLFMMWLLMRGDEGCILLSETHPSVERQQALCFPASDPDWTADRVACVGYVTADDYWPCDVFGFSRLPLQSESGPNLMKVWQRHKTRQQE